MVPERAFCWEPRVLLWGSLNGGPSEVVGQGYKQMVRTESVEYPIWRFDNVLVGLARFNNNVLSFSVTVDGVKTDPDFWTYGGDHPTRSSRRPRRRRVAGDESAVGGRQ